MGQRRQSARSASAATDELLRTLNISAEDLHQAVKRATRRRQQNALTNLRAELSCLLEMAAQAPIRAAAAALRGVQLLLEEQMEAKAGQDVANALLSAIAESLPLLGRALRRPEMLASTGPAVSASWEMGAVATTIMIVLLHLEPVGDLQKALEHLQPAAAACLRFATYEPPDTPLQQAARRIRIAAKLARTAAEDAGLPPEGEPLLLQLLQRCRVGVEADMTNAALAAAATRPRSASGTPAAVGSGGSNEDEPSLWALPLGLVMQALAMVPAARQRLTPATEVAMLQGAQALLCHERSPHGAGDPEVVKGILVLLADGLAGAAAEALLNNLVVSLEGVSAAVLPTPTGGAVPPRAVADAAARLSIIASIAGATAARLLGSRPVLWRRWGSTLALALKRVSKWTQQREPHMNLAIEELLFMAARNLSEAAAAALQPAAAAGVDALEQEAALQLVNALTSHTHAPHEALARLSAAAVRADDPPSIIQSFRSAAAAIEAAVETVLAAAESQPPRLASQRLVSAACEAASALIGLASNEDVFLCWFPHQAPGERPDMAALQRGAGLIGRLQCSFGAAAAPCLGTGACASGLVLALRYSLTQRPLPVAAVQAVRATCRALAAVVGTGSAQGAPSAPGCGRRQLADHWAAFAAEFRKVLRQEPAARRQRLEKALQEVDAALQPQRGQQQAAAAGSDTATGQPAGRSQASADEAMRSLLAEEAQAAAAPSKAALKRAHKKATAAAQAAAAEPAAPVAAPPDGDQLLQAAAKHIDSSQNSRWDAAAELAQPGPGSAAHDRTSAAGAGSATTSSAADAAAEPPSTSHACPTSGLPAVEDSLRKLHLQAGATGQASGTSGVETWMLCPLGQGVMVDPVLYAGDGETYERAAITEWLHRHGTSPVTGQSLPTRQLIPNHALRGSIQAAVGRR